MVPMATNCIQSAIDKAVAEERAYARRLAAFIRGIGSEECWGHSFNNLDGGDTQDKAVECGILVESKATQKDYDDWYGEYGDVGDTIYKFAPKFLEYCDAIEGKE